MRLTAGEYGGVSSPWLLFACGVACGYGGAMVSPSVRRLAGAVAHVLRSRARGHRVTKGDTSPSPGDVARSTSNRAPVQDNGVLPDAYPGDFTGVFSPRYAPSLDGDPDPGEIVWAWVPYEEDHSQGKDRPVLLVGHDGPWLLGMMLTSRDRDQRSHPNWVEIGSGPWDSQGRDSEVRVDRLIRLAPDRVRREGAILPQNRFAAVVAQSPFAR